MTSVDSNLFRAALTGFATSVTVLSVRDELDDIAMTATSFASVSMVPPLVSVGVEHETHMHDVLSRNDLFGVSILGSGHQAIAGRFGISGRPSARLLLAGEEHHRGEATQALLIDGGVSAMECEIVTRHDAGDHMLVIATVLRVDYINDQVLPLLRYRHRYHQLS